MGNKKDYTSVLVMDKLNFDKIKFERSGMQNENEIKFKLQVVFGKSREDEIYKVTIMLYGDKEDEYEIEITISGYFSFKDNEQISKEEKEALISKNAVAIMMPYLRSEVSLLTAQPNVECVVLPPFNINNVMEEE